MQNYATVVHIYRSPIHRNIRYIEHPRPCKPCKLNSVPDHFSHVEMGQLHGLEHLLAVLVSQNRASMRWAWVCEGSLQSHSHFPRNTAAIRKGQLSVHSLSCGEANLTES